MTMTTPAFLTDRQLRLLLFGGKGGVGKTSCASATALHWAHRDRHQTFLLVSTDPAHSLTDSLAGLVPPPNLRIVELDAAACLARFRQQHRQKLHAIASRGTFLDDEDISQFLNLSLPGLDELMAFLEIARWVEEQTYQGIIVDTAPTGHTLRLLAMPALIRQWLAALDSLLAKHRYMKRLYCRSYRSDELDQFLEELALSVRKMEALLQNSTCCQFVLVMLAEAMCLSESVSLITELRRLRVTVSEIIINRIYPQNSCPACADGRIRQGRELARIRHSKEFSGAALWGIPLYPHEVCGAEPLAAFWTEVIDLSHVNLPPASRIPPAPPQVELPAEPPSSKASLLFVAGKGGVGKTTLASATALRIAHDFPGREVLLFSTDPAHSISACLELPVGPAPKRISAGLTAMEINAQAEFNSLKQLYYQELKTFLQSLLPNLDLTYDREAMEKLLDLSPPGLDEVLGLTRVMELLDQGQYQTVVLDSAPTGHLIRLLEMPELIEGWLKVFFGLFLKYKQIFHLPKVTQRLVLMSKNLKRLRAMLNHPTHCSLYAVSILTEMAFQETKDLITACERLGIKVPVLFLNLATPKSECALCAAWHRRESMIREQFESSFPAQHQVLIYRQGEPRGLERLHELAQALYGAPESCLNYV